MPDYGAIAKNAIRREGSRVTGQLTLENYGRFLIEIKKLPEKVQKKELRKILRRAMKPALEIYKANIPVGKRPHTRYLKGGSRVTYQPGNLRKSIKIRTIPKRRTGDDNVGMEIRPTSGRKGQPDGYYKFMVIPEGQQISPKRRIGKRTGRPSLKGTRKNRNIVVTKAARAATTAARVIVLQELSADMQRYLDKLIAKNRVR